MAGKVKNVLLFLTDQQRKDTIGAYGNPFVRTPHLDRLAREGVRFERCYAATAPTRSAAPPVPAS
jgi:arylsulfatase A-like enzyme